jgi:predicted MFS family arabinose efflux permease
VLGLVCSLAVLEGYVSTLLTQTVTYAADDFGADRAGQGVTLAVARAGVLLTLVLTARADRLGRRRALATSAFVASVTAALGALAPNLGVLGATQALAFGAAGAMALLLAIVAAEEVPAGCRAYAVSLLTLAGGLGAGMCLWVLPVADTSRSGWRLVYVVPLLGVLVARAVFRRLPETKRFAVEHRKSSLREHGGRLWLLAIAGLLGALFLAPAFQFQNDFLRNERGFSAARISLYSILTGTPGAIGVVVGGRLADTRGRRIVAVVAIGGGTIATLATFAAAGWPMWAFASSGTIVGAAIAPALGVFGPELFPTAHRGRANGVIQVVTLAGSAIGLVSVGVLADRWGSYIGPMAITATGPLLVALLVGLRFPETAGLELEALNPEDAPPNRVF